MKLASTLLSSHDNNRQNNFTLIRIMCAWLVIYGHSYAIQNSINMNDPLNIIFKGSDYIGGFAVDAFFIISGYLVTASLLKQGAAYYAVSRILRVFPALFICVLLSVFALGWAVTSLDTHAYFTNPQTLKYFINLLPFINIEYLLPGVFENHSDSAVNGSLWTLIVELRCYFLLMLLGLFGAFRNKIMANFTLLALFAFGLFFYESIPFLGKGATIHWPSLSFFFLIGVFFYINRDKIWLDPRLAFLALILIFSSFGEKWFHAIFPMSFAYFIFYFAYSTPFINVDKKVGDISYGIYIYGWPTQELVAYLFPALHPKGNILISTAIVLPLAYLSWHFIEHPSLSLKNRFFQSIIFKKIHSSLSNFIPIPEKT